MGCLAPRLPPPSSGGGLGWGSPGFPTNTVPAVHDPLPALPLSGGRRRCVRARNRGTYASPLGAGVRRAGLVEVARVFADAFHAQIDVGILGALAGSTAADLEIDRVPRAAVDEAMAVGHAGF